MYMNSAEKDKYVCMYESPLHCRREMTLICRPSPGCPQCPSVFGAYHNNRHRKSPTYKGEDTFTSNWIAICMHKYTLLCFSFFIGDTHWLHHNSQDAAVRRKCSLRLPMRAEWPRRRILRRIRTRYNNVRYISKWTIGLQLKEQHNVQISV